MSDTETVNLPTTKLWDERIGAFAKTLGTTLDAANAALEKLIGKPDDDNVAALADEALVTDDDFLSAFADAPKARVRKAVRDLRASVAPAPAPAAAGAAPAMTVMLPTPPDDDSFLEALRTGGVPKVSATEVAAAVRIFVAHQLGLDEVPDSVLAAMEAHAEAMEEPIGEEFVEIRKIIVERKYGEILEALNLKGHSVTVKHREALAAKMANLPAVLGGFQAAIAGWRDEWMTRAANPAVLMQTISAALGGGGAAGLLQGMATHPDTGAVVSSAEGVIDAFNRMFSGYGRATARAMGYDAVKVKKVLSDARLPAAIGASTREEMLKRLGVGVSSDMVRLEGDLGRYVLAVYQLGEGKVASDQLPLYIVALANLGAQIPWDRVGTNGKPRIGSRERVGGAVVPERQRY